jgi:hypothetical protein
MTLVRDARFGMRLLVRNKLSAVAAITVVAPGIGATTAVFSVVRAVILQPLPCACADGLVVLRADSGRGTRQPILTVQEYNARHARTDIFKSCGSSASTPT